MADETPTSSDILDRVSSGERSAFSDCMDRYGGLVWSLARRLSPTRADAEDAVQDIFLAVWKSAGRYDAAQGSEATFIATIARRRLIDRARKRGRRPGGGPLFEDQASAGIESEEVGNAIETSDDAVRAKAAMKQLSQDQQRVLQLAVYHGLSHEKIAESTDLPLGTVKTHIRRGLIRIREILESEAKAGPGTGAASENGVGR